MGDSHHEVIERAFTQQAAAFEDPRFNRVFTKDAEWLFERLPLSQGDLLLDVAAGTGHAARALAPSVRIAVAVDATAAMLVAGRSAAARAGLENVIFQRADAAELPFLDESFDVVVCRFAVHHFEHPELQVREIARCVRPGGRIAVADLIAKEPSEVAEAQNHLERLRDPSHTRMLSRPELAGLLQRAGLESIDVEVRHTERPLEPWLAQTETDETSSEAIRARLRAEIEGSASPSGFHPREADGALLFTQSFASAIARKPQ